MAHSQVSKLGQAKNKPEYKYAAGDKVPRAHMESGH